MAVTLLRAYGGFPVGATVILPDATETALITQELAVSFSITSVPSLVGGPDQFITQGGNLSSIPRSGQGPITVPQGPTILPNMPLGTAALTSAGASSVHVAGTINLSEIFVPYWNTWKGLAVLNGTVVGTDNMLVALYGIDGRLIANSAVAGTLSAGASAFQNRDFLAPVTLAPGRYFCGVQCDGTTATSNKFVSANGVNVLTGAIAGVFGTVPVTVAVPTTFTTAQGCVCQLYS